MNEKLSEIIFGAGLWDVMILREQKGKRGYNIIQSIFYVVLTALALYIILKSPLFQVREISVAGNSELSRDLILSVSGLKTGENTLEMDLKAATARLKSIPAIESANVERKLPSRIVIYVAERKAVALLPSPEGFLEVDQEGVYIKKGSLNTGGLPVITGLEVKVPQPGSRIDTQGLGEALEVIRGLPREVLPLLSEVNLGGSDNVLLYTLEGVQCRLGRPVDLGQKGNILLQVLGELKSMGKKIEYVDLTYAGSPVVKYVD